MRVMVIVKATKESEAGVIRAEALETMGEFNDKLLKAGVMLTGEGLQPSSRGKRVRFSPGQAQGAVIDGPFAEAKELIAGYWIWKVDSLEHALEWARKCPNPHGETFELEIRPIYEAKDLEEAIARQQR